MKRNWVVALVGALLVVGVGLGATLTIRAANAASRAAPLPVGYNGANGWHLLPGHPRVGLLVKRGRHDVYKAPLRGDVPPGERCHFVFELPATAARPAEADSVARADSIAGQRKS